uniref:Uncharacterized protein n=1 Tax=Branchiostoma floridae TaxID=7739 RepID=C3Z198_BRAFL|eukprot:XP_002597785.1 hypothetical protein BRAFLDRAFT_121656 [Branchiostoma floridae]
MTTLPCQQPFPAEQASSTLPCQQEHMLGWELSWELSLRITDGDEDSYAPCLNCNYRDEVIADLRQELEKARLRQIPAFEKNRVKLQLQSRSTRPSSTPCRLTNRMLSVKASLPRLQYSRRRSQEDISDGENSDILATREYVNICIESAEGRKLDYRDSDVQDLVENMLNRFEDTVTYRENVSESMEHSIEKTTNVSHSIAISWHETLPMQRYLCMTLEDKSSNPYVFKHSSHDRHWTDTFSDSDHDEEVVVVPEIEPHKLHPELAKLEPQTCQRRTHSHHTDRLSPPISKAVDGALETTAV